jgi:hypothetical protein
LIGPAERLEELADELSVTAHSVLWSAACILWAEPEHVAYAVLEAGSVQAVERYIAALTPSGWTTRALPVFTLPGQLAAARQLLAAPAIPVVQPPVAEPVPVAEPHDDRDTADTLEGLTVGSTEPEAAGDSPSPAMDEPAAESTPPPASPGTESPELPPDKWVTRLIASPVTRPTVAHSDVPPHPEVPEPVAPPERGAIPDSGAVTRFVPRPAGLESLGSPESVPDLPQPIAELVPPSEPYAPSESSTVILEPPPQRTVGVRLLARTGPAQDSAFDVGEAGATLGRLPDNSICLTDGRLSRHHARIEFRDGGYWLSDLGSQNGTLVNDSPVIGAHRLQAGDSIVLGTTRLTVMLDPDD